MIGVLIVVGIVFYATMYSGLKTLRHEPVSIIEALTGRGMITAEPKAAPGSTRKTPTSGVPKKR